MTNEAEAILDEFDDLLDAEREALRNGKLEIVERMYKRKQSLVGALAQFDEQDAERVGPVREKLARNQDLLASAAEGVRSVAQRLATVRRVREGLDTYDETGRRKSVDVNVGGSLERRA